jgi:hypothetical protein
VALATTVLPEADENEIMARNRFVALLVALAPFGITSLAHAQFQIASADGNSSLKLGVLTQVQGEWLDTADGSATAQNLFVRRIRLLVGGKLGERVSLFFDTDSPNLGKGGADGRKNEATIYVQDLILTFAASPRWKFDGGMLLLPLAYHTGQSAATLLGVDYGPYAFLASSPTNCRVGRDYGVETRGYLFNQHLEVRAGVFQGIRGTNATRPFRSLGRVVWYPLETQSDYFYTGTTHGKRKLLSIGASYDRQSDYSSTGADIFFDHPVGGANAITAQVDYWRLDGGSLLSDLPRQHLWFGEAGFYFAAVKLEPFIQVNRRDFADRGLPDEAFGQIGLAYWVHGDKFNVKLGVGRFDKDHAPHRTQVVAQFQALLW